MPQLNKEERNAYNRAYYQLNKNKLKCEHNRSKSSCKECGGNRICEHNRDKYSCIECGGSQICEHQRYKRNCKDCGGIGFMQGEEICQSCIKSFQKAYYLKFKNTGIMNCGEICIDCSTFKNNVENCKKCGGTGIIENQRKCNCEFNRNKSLNSPNFFKFQGKQLQHGEQKTLHDSFATDASS